MKIILSVLLTLCSIVWGKDVSLSSLPISEYVDTEISTNIVLGTTFEDFREINIEVSSSKGISKISIPMDCSGLEHNLFYYIKFQSDIISRLLMNGKYTKGGIDIAFGDIYSVWYERELDSKIYHKSLAPIGFQTKGTRDLSIYGGDY